MLCHRVFWWAPSGELAGETNVGDGLGPEIVKKIARRVGREQWISDFNGQLFAVGSTLHYARDGDVIWGSGVNGKVVQEMHSVSSLDVRAVRGPRTRQVLLEKGGCCPAVFGDPGILCSFMWPMPRTRRREGITYVPHFREALKRHSDSELQSVRVLSPFRPIVQFIEVIASSSLVLSSSLHGIVIAESYGVPAILVENQCGETHLKYADYYEGTGREEFPVARSISEALAVDAEVPDLSGAQESLLNAFPYDLLQR